MMTNDHQTVLRALHQVDPDAYDLVVAAAEAQLEALRSGRPEDRLRADGLFKRMAERTAARSHTP